jgi:hypothetical protein
MNWFKKSQNVLNEYENIGKNLGSINIIGPGANTTVNVLGQTVSIRPLFDQVINLIKPILIQKGVNTIDTSGLGAGVEGLAISNEPGKIHVDVSKIANMFAKQIPNNPNIAKNPEVKNQLLEWLTKEIKRELLGTSSHEAEHLNDYRNKYQDWKKNPNQQGPAFNQVQEAPGPKFEAETVNKFKNNL